jgi:hypothetical protein
MVDVMSERASWICGLSLIGLTMPVHAAALVAMAHAMTRIKLHDRLERQMLSQSAASLIVICVIGLAGVGLAALHGVEAMIWAVAYLGFGALDSPMDAMFYSLDCMTTRGASDLKLETHWRMLGALEAVDGMLLFGLSTAFLFAVIQMSWPMLARRA